MELDRLQLNNREMLPRQRVEIIGVDLSNFCSTQRRISRMTGAASITVGEIDNNINIILRIHLNSGVGCGDREEEDGWISSAVQTFLECCIKTRIIDY